jgi:hypothetical protein
MFKAGVGDRITEFRPEVGGTHTLSPSALVEKLNDVGEGETQDLLSSARLGWVLLEEFRELLFVEYPRDFWAIPEALYDGICVTGLTHIDETS